MLFSLICFHYGKKSNFINSRPHGFERNILFKTNSFLVTIGTIQCTNSGYYLYYLCLHLSHIQYRVDFMFPFLLYQSHHFPHNHYNYHQRLLMRDQVEFGIKSIISHEGNKQKKYQKGSKKLSGMVRKSNCPFTFLQLIEKSMAKINFHAQI
ncbi:hypothetical protein BpHYR1_038415 [Brachionus plicatilis]|uniref:Uncharacterized protein n=1 Tax=Brachionus plicatilis TaxID=10195 RepID=A0A3M7PQ19_BRAPC|nr:hypothetical protein BpHYR1_038415 [Brachionus plicatilis]